MMSPDEIRQLVARDRKAQGLPPTVTDPEALRRIAALVAAKAGPR